MTFNQAHEKLRKDIDALTIGTEMLQMLPSHNAQNVLPNQFHNA